MQPRAPKIVEQEAEAATGLGEGANGDSTKRSADDPSCGPVDAPKPKLAKLSISLSASGKATALPGGEKPASNEGTT